jgi:hypothetical protein
MTRILVISKKQKFIMTVIIHPSKKPDGCGDLGFMVNFANILAKAENRPFPIAIVSEHKDLILKLYGSSLDKRIELYSTQESHEAMQRGELIPSLFIQGPTYHKFNEKINQGEHRIPVIYTGEYTDNDYQIRPYQISNRSASELVIHDSSKGLPVDIVLSGIGDFSTTIGTIEATKKRACQILKHPTKHSGIFLDDGLMKQGIACLDNPIAFREETLKKLSNETREKVESNLTEEFLVGENVDYYFFYGHKKESFDAYLNFVKQRQKSNKGKKCVLIVCGTFADQQEKETAVLDEDGASSSGQASEKTDILMIGLKQIPSSDFRLLLSLAKDLVVVTGDQSFSEAIALHKIPFYELPGHKMSFYKGFLKEVKKIGAQNILKILHMFYEEPHLSEGIIFQNDNSQSISDILSAINGEWLSEELRKLLSHLNEYWRIDHDIIERVASMPPSQPLQSEIIEALTNEIERLRGPKQKKYLKLFSTRTKPAEEYVTLARLYRQIIVELVSGHMPFPKIVSNNFGREGAIDIPEFITKLIQRQKEACKIISFPEGPLELIDFNPMGFAGPSSI